MNAMHRRRNIPAIVEFTVAYALVIAACANLWAARKPEGFPISYTLDEDGQVSLAVYNGDGRLLRELLTEPQAAGRHSVIWDGLDQTGSAVEPGRYQWKMLRTQGLTTHYRMMLGTNGTPDHAAWPGDHAGPSAVLVDGDDMYVGARAGETVPVLIKQNLDGTGATGNCGQKAR